MKILANSKFPLQPVHPISHYCQAGKHPLQIFVIERSQYYVPESEATSESGLEIVMPVLNCEVVSLEMDEVRGKGLHFREVFVLVLAAERNRVLRILALEAHI